ncbi:hypothetical protein E5676_scaffold68G00730 [Cucumis melo var. makuwa]|uniref:Retrotransposon protein n=1 Tax=Cucumis melo var. makuwa TaxID=1194695 RepID=A0A5A7TVM1_CUCMM|nr:hypothetical protein E6C27_scaffold230G002160 [Cucumis melo var. makuwa]TYK04769.1 hypothetical protein E5676_scaffold68G00730 [Cucumis melo var. makuwa]
MSRKETCVKFLGNHASTWVHEGASRKVRRGRQVAISVPVTRKANRAQASGKISSNPHDSVRQNVEESMFDRFAQRLTDHFMPIPSTVDKRFGIERLKALGAMTFEGKTNLADANKCLSLVEKCFGVMKCPKKEESS